MEEVQTRNGSRKVGMKPDLIILETQIHGDREGGFIYLKEVILQTPVFVCTSMTKEEFGRECEAQDIDKSPRMTESIDMGKNLIPTIRDGSIFKTT